MTNNLKLLCVSAHPDDETLGTGGILAKYAAEGVKMYLFTARHRKRGWLGGKEDYPRAGAFGKIRQAGLQAAAKLPGIHQVDFLNYLGGELDQTSSAEVISKIVGHL